MKTQSIAFAITLSLAGIASAHDHKPTPECQKVHDACTAAGYKGRATFKSCLKPLMKGDKVANVTLADEDVIACKNSKGPANPAMKDDKPHEAESPE